MRATGVGPNERGLRETRCSAVHGVPRGADSPVVKDSIVATNGRLSVSENVPRESKARSDVVLILGVEFIGRHNRQVADLAAAGDPGRLVKRALQAILFMRAAKQIPAHAEIESQVAPHLPVVLEEEPVLIQNVIALASRSGGLERLQVAEECFDALIGTAQQFVIQIVKAGLVGRREPGGPDARGWRVSVVSRAEGDVRVDAAIVVPGLQGAAEVPAALKSGRAVNVGYVVGVLADRRVAALRKCQVERVGVVVRLIHHTGNAARTVESHARALVAVAKFVDGARRQGVVGTGRVTPAMSALGAGGLARERRV